MPERKDIWIFFCGNDPLDRTYAERIRGDLGQAAEVRLVDVDELDRIDAPTVRGNATRSVPVFVVSPSMLANPEHRASLRLSVPTRNLAGHRAFYVCRGTDAQEIGRDHPDLRPLLDDVMLGSELDHPALIADLTRLLESSASRPSLASASGGAALLLLQPVGALAHLVYAAAPLSALALIGRASGLALPALSTSVLASHVLFASGYALARIKPMDVGPWLGPHWKLSEQASGRHEQPDGRPRHADACPSQREFRQAIGSWRLAVAKARLWALALLGLYLWPAVHAIAVGSVAAHLLWLVVAGAIAAAAGLAANRSVRGQAYVSIGLTPAELERTERFFARFDAYMNPRTLLAHMRGRHRLLAPLLRRWTRGRPRVFISYAWADEAKRPTAAVLHSTLTKLGISSFLDADRIAGSFAAWRAAVVAPLLDCTHLFVILGSSHEEADVFHREVRLSLQRWFTEAEPSVIVVVDPDTASQLGEQPLPTEVKFLLRHCPKLTPDEVADPALLEEILAQRQRQGVYRDWATLVRSRSALRPILGE